MVTKEEFEKQWHINDSKIKNIFFKGGYMIANDYSFLYLKLNEVNFIHLIFFIDDRFTTVGFIKPKNVLKVM